MDKDPSTKKSTDQAEKVPGDEVPEQQPDSTDKSPEQRDSKEMIEDFEYDCNLVKEDKYGLGINFDSDLIVNGLFDLPEDDERIQHEIEDNKLDTPDKIALVRAENAKRDENFRNYVDDFDIKDELGKVVGSSLKHSRVEPFGPLSPLTIYQCVNPKPKADGSHEIKISPTFISQMEHLKSKCPDTTIVVPFYNKNREVPSERANVPTDPTEISDYTEICLQLIEQLGGGDGLTLEIGLETNATQSTGKEFSGSAKEQFASKVDPIAYAKLYCEAATKIKAIYPNVKLSISGTACYDIGYLRHVLFAMDTKTDHRTSELVDTISYHPYGDFREDGEYSAAHIQRGRFVNDNLSFEEQHKKMLELAERFNIKTVDIGEINFNSDDPNRKSKLEKFLALPTRIGESGEPGEPSLPSVPTKLWPSAAMPKTSK